MDNKQFTTLLSKRCSLDYKAGASAIASLIDIIATESEAGKSVAIPGFGTFSPLKKEEELSTDLSTGETLLLPPTVSLEFMSSNILSKRLKL